VERRDQRVLAAVRAGDRARRLIDRVRARVAFVRGRNEQRGDEH
jgi:hypothetical protein